MSVVVSVASNYQGALGGMFGHVEIEMDRQAVELADNSTVVMCEFGLIVTQPGAAPNQFIPWGSVRRIHRGTRPAGTASGGRRLAAERLLSITRV